MAKTTRETADENVSETPSSGSDMLRYLIVLALVAVGAWYYYFRQPVVYSAQQTQGKTMGTDFSVKVCDFPETGDWTALAAKIQERLDAVDRTMSTFKPDSEISRFNASRSDEWFEVSKETAQVVRLALDVSEASGGAFDVTVSPLVAFWGFAPPTGLKADAFSEEERAKKVAEIKERIGHEKLEVQLDPPALKKSHPELAIDLSAIAKGYAVDVLAELLEENKIVHYMVEVGGEVRCRGNKGDQGDWKIGIEKPLLAPPGTLPGLQRAVRLGDRALATSGDYQNYRDIGGVRYSHLIDPRSGFPVERIPEAEAMPTERLGSVSVVDKSCARADAFATALFVLGEKDGLELAREKNLNVLFLFRSEKNVREASTPNFPAPLE